MMMFIFSIITMWSYFYLVYLISRVLKNIYFKKNLFAVASKYELCDMENNT